MDLEEQEAIPTDFVKEVKERIEAVLPKVNKNVVFKACNEHTFMKNTYVVVLTKKGEERSMSLERDTWEKTGCKSDDAAVTGFLNMIIATFTR
ncbi:MAG: hypothetical protein GY721_12730 [Deltaproteobacteria bacterium]|nr:hypothetical protein [Deltaproteobacteria bacterium]